MHIKSIELVCFVVGQFVSYIQIENNAYDKRVML